MNKKNSTRVIAVVVGGLLGCSTPPPAVFAPPDAVPSVEQINVAPEKERLADLLDPREMVRGRVCTLGTSCLELDPRPFEVCLLSTKHCADKATEPLLASQAQTVITQPQTALH